MEHLLKELRDSYDVVVLDSPPLLPVADAAVLARLTDGAVVVANCRKIHRHQFADALETLDAVDARCLGVVTNQVRSGTEQNYYGRNPQQRHPVLGRLFRSAQVFSRRRGIDGSSASATSL
jgi:Mrp family chromosome partitioning ATPase